MVVAQQQAWQYALHGDKVADGGSFFHSVNPFASDMYGIVKRSVTCETRSR
jgi:hypothetical protein